MVFRRRAHTLALAALVALVACVDHGPGPENKKIAGSYIADHLIQAVPPNVTRLDVALGGGEVVYAGNVVDRTTLVPGQAVRITHYWRVVKPPGPHWRVFARLLGAPNTADFMNLPASDMELGHPPARWKAGEIIADEQDVVLRPDWHSQTATLEVGLIHTRGHDVGDRMDARAAAPGVVVDRAIVARTLPVDLSKAPPPPGTIYVPHAAGPITIDGVANEPAWARAVASPEFATADGCPDPIGSATAKMLWDEQYLYLYVSVIDSDIYSPFKDHDDSLWKYDDLEIFIDADGNRQGYVELQVNPNGATFDTWWATTRAAPMDKSWDSGMVAAVKVRGTPDKAGDTDQGWDAEIKIPVAAVKGRDAAMRVRIPPQIGDRWHLNVVRVDWKNGMTSQPPASSWNRITCSDFHALDRMLTAVFADETGSIARPPPPGPAAHP